MNYLYVFWNFYILNPSVNSEKFIILITLLSSHDEILE